MVEAKPDSAVSIIECDMKVDFAPPVGYKEPELEPMNVDHEEDVERNDLIQQAVEQENVNKFQAFGGEGQRLDGKSKNLKVPKSDQPIKRERGIPNYSYKKGKLTFAKAKSLKPEPEEPMEDLESGFTAFSGSGKQLRIRKKKL